jgi:Tfp pilus assembly protein PilZ
MAEFQALSLKVSAKTADATERARWRDLRTRLAKSTPPVPPPQLPRQHERAQKKLKVALAPVTALHSTFTEEVSGGGIKLRVQGHLEIGTIMVLRLELGEPGPLTVSARVAWCRRDGGHFMAGLEFVDLRVDERERIEAWAALTTAPPSTTRT